MFGEGEKSPDGYTKPYIMETLIEYGLKEYPETFQYIKSNLTKVKSDEKTNKTKEIELTDNKGSHQTIKLSDFQASLGHSEVFKGQDKTRFYNDFTATGFSVNFVLTIPMDSLIERRLGGTSNPEEIKKFVLNNGILPCSDLFNLHVTIFDQEFVTVEGNEVAKLYGRATEGANFNVDDLTGRKDDIFNVWQKINYYFEGEAELVSVGSCTRHTWLENMPRIDGDFLNGQSGVGLSFAACEHDVWLNNKI